MDEILLQKKDNSRIKDAKLELILNEQGVARGTVEIDGWIEFIQIKKQLDVGEPLVKISSSDLVEPILDITVDKSTIYPVRYLCSGIDGSPLADFKFGRIPVKGTVKVEVYNGTPRSRMEVLIRYG